MKTGVVLICGVCFLAGAGQGFGQVAVVPDPNAVTTDQMVQSLDSPRSAGGISLGQEIAVTMPQGVDGVKGIGAPDSCSIDQGASLIVTRFSADGKSADVCYRAERPDEFAWPHGEWVSCPSGVVFPLAVRDLALFETIAEEKNIAYAWNSRQAADIRKSGPRSVRDLKTGERLRSDPITVPVILAQPMMHGRRTLDIGTPCSVFARREIEVIGFSSNENLTLLEYKGPGWWQPGRKGECPAGAAFFLKTTYLEARLKKSARQ
ncbi:MAG: hypothetical protein NTX64_17085 [Elusimicrobia bacterium]|nr:hypothetical protein [Elusimicrobiota bacterium]